MGYLLGYGGRGTCEGRTPKPDDPAKAQAAGLVIFRMMQVRWVMVPTIWGHRVPKQGHLPKARPPSVSPGRRHVHPDQRTIGEATQSAGILTATMDAGNPEVVTTVEVNIRWLAARRGPLGLLVSAT